MTCQGLLPVYGLDTVLKINLWSSPMESGLEIQLSKGPVCDTENDRIPWCPALVRLADFIQGGRPQGPAGRNLDTIHYSKGTGATNVGLHSSALLLLVVLVRQGLEGPVRCYSSMISGMPKVCPSRQNTDMGACGLSSGVLPKPHCERSQIEMQPQVKPGRPWSRLMLWAAETRAPMMLSRLGVGVSVLGGGAGFSKLTGQVSRPQHLNHHNWHQVQQKWAEPSEPCPKADSWRKHHCCFVQSLSCVRLFVTPRTAARQAPLSPAVSWSLFQFTRSVMLSNHLILCCPLLLLPSIFQASGSFPMSRLFTSGGQRIGASVIVFPMKDSWLTASYELSHAMPWLF